ncbi:oxidoreductase [Bordetella genomosp. 9]|uniref:3-oxoacyl-ACP reductase family protein n=1 Tax=Bordetella genomosp. 9 TaxID=1416803 RepID=UPI000A2944D9|nr:3-oxoacyl-ACP reductase family protein [Bordetella genomosp. 9]ARP91840.1 oxidoreductase [Bordetella genomosp. 9]
MQALKDRVALVTGGSRGIGAAIARRLAQDGASVALTYASSPDKAAAVAAEIRAAGADAVAIPADSADPGAVQAAVTQVLERFGRLDILVNNAGILIPGALDEIDLDTFERTMAVNVRAVFVASQAAARHMGPDGRIISIGSCLAHRAGRPGISLYAMSKSALIGLTKGMARDLGGRGITVNIVDPGPTDTDMNPAEGERADALRAAMALGRYGHVDDIAATVAHLAGPGGRFITGASIPVDGGINA